MTTVSSPPMFNADWPAAVIASRNGRRTAPSRNGRITRIGSPPW
jgi:hypothetical protein